jgi:hypothetical protein
MKITSPRYKLISAVYEAQPHFGAAAGAPGAGARASEREKRKARLAVYATLQY